MPRPAHPASLPDHRILGLVDALRADPMDDGPRGILADLLDDLGPPPFDVWPLPYWLFRAWLPLAPRETSYGRQSRSKCGMYEVMNAWLRDHWKETGRYKLLNRTGGTTVGGLPCFVWEPYNEVREAVDYLRPVATLFNCPIAYSRRARRHPTACRILLFPFDGAILRPERHQRILSSKQVSVGM